MFAVIVPSRGDEARLGALLDALERQTFPRERWGLVVGFDGTSLDPALLGRVSGLGGRVVPLADRAGPGAARNRAAALATEEWLAFTEDDVVPAPDWLERAAERLAREPELDVLEGRTVKPGGRPVHRQAQDRPLYLPTNLFIRRALFERIGGYGEDFFDRASGVYFREDADLGFRLEEADARVGREPAAVVTHPEEHAAALDPLRWARRHMMDALLQARHPRRFRERLETHRFGPFTVRRPIVRACEACVLATAVALVNLAAGLPRVAAGFGVLALLAFLPVWAKWRFDPRRLPVLVLVPFVMVWSLGVGHRRATRLVPPPA